MSRAGTVFVLLIALIVAVATVPISARADADPESASLTEYLHNHKLPAVGAQITTGEDGVRTVMLYGFVATQLGFDNAEKRTRSFLHDPNIRVVNRIKIEPQLLALGKHGSQAESGTESGQSPDNGPPAIVDNAPPPPDVGDITQYQTQSPAYDPYAMAGQGGSTMSGSSLLIPLLGGLLIYGAMGGLGSPGYSSPPTYYYPQPPPRPYYPPPRHHHHGGLSRNLFTPPPAPLYTPHVASVPHTYRYTPPPLVRYTAPPTFRYSAPTTFASPPAYQHSYTGGYHGSFGGSPGFGGGFHGGGHH